MKILKLTIHNIASIADAVIDFSSAPLKDAGLFLITGKTGAGKSTILDCICLALYDKTPRLSSTLFRDDIKDFNSAGAFGADDTRQMLSKHAAEGYASLEFIGNNGGRYRATWSVSRARQKVNGKLQNKKMILERLDKNIAFTKKGEIAAEIAVAVNLDFNQFCRTVMLAQGEFTRFLNSSDNDKSAILSKITGTGIYAVLGARIYEKYKEQMQILDRCAASLQGIAVLTEEQLEEKRKSLVESDSRIKLLTSKWELQVQLLNTLTSIAENEKLLESLQEKKKIAFNAFGAYSNELDKLKEEAGNLKKDIESLKAERKLFDDRAAVLSSHESIITLIDRIDDAKKRIIANSEIIVSKENHKKNILLPECNEAKKMIADLQQQLAAKEKEIKQLNKELEDIDLPKLRSDREALMQTRVDFENLKIRVTSYKKELADLEEDKNNLARAEKNSEEISARIEELREPEIAAKVRLETTQEIYDKLFASSEDILSKIRSSLNTGDTCPLCRNKIIEALPSDECIAAITTGRKEDLDKARKDLEGINKLKSGLASELRAEEKITAQLKSRIQNNISLDKAESELRSICAKMGISDPGIDTASLMQIYCDNIVEIQHREQAIKSSIAEGEDLEKTLKKKTIELRALQSQLEVSTANHNDKLLKINALDNQVISLNDQIGQLRTDEAELTTKLYVELQDTPYVYATEDFTTLRSSLQKDASILKSLTETLNKKITLHGNITITLNNHLTTLASIKKLLSIAEMEDPHSVASGRGFSNPDSISGEDGPVTGRRSSGLDRVSIPRNQLADFGTGLLGEISAINESMTAASMQLNASRETLLSYRKEYPEEEISIPLCTRRVAEIKEIIETMNREMGAIQSEIDHDAANREKMQQLHEEFRKQENMVDKWRKLQELFGDAEGKKFRKIAQSYILAELIHSANHYLAGFSDRYRLSIEPGTFVIIVEDAWNGYARRPASTISGGESFLVSLSLALALSDLNTDFSVDILFIDEGFGSLSQEYLQSAISTLRTLHGKSGRRIGIISHVEELRERIPVKITVSSSPSNPSSLVVVE